MNTETNTQLSLAPYQRVINAAVRLVNGLRLHDLHRLPAEMRIQYKLCLMVDHALTGTAPTYVTISFNLSPPLRHVMQLCSRQLPTVCLSHAPDSSLVREPSESLLPRRGINCLVMSAVSTTQTLLRKKLKTFLFTKFYFC